MPLDNTASIKDIITSLQNLEGINAKAELASVIGSPVTDEDTMSTMVNQIQTAKNELANILTDSGEPSEGIEPLITLIERVSSLNNDITIAYGTQMSSAYAGTSSITVTGLSFMPDLVVFFTIDGIRMGVSVNYPNFPDGESKGVQGVNRVTSSTLGGPAGYSFTSDGFTARVAATNVTALYDWIAIKFKA